jgi:putative colanic acid biosynthesis acetyltransferase WcaF
VKAEKRKLETLDIAGNRSASNYSRKELVLRVVWNMGELVFRLTPRPLFRARNAILRIFGAKIGRDVHVYPSAHIYFPWNLEIGDWSAIGEHALVYNLGRVVIGKRATVSQGAHLCAGTHDYRKLDLPLLKPPIHVGDDAWVAADAFVGPGVVIGKGAVVGARAVVVKNVPEWTVVAGNPARVIKERRLESGVDSR